jgi:hypothetical protein
MSEPVMAKPSRTTSRRRTRSWKGRRRALWREAALPARSGALAGLVALAVFALGRACAGPELPPPVAREPEAVTAPGSVFLRPEAAGRAERTTPSAVPRSAATLPPGPYEVLCIRKPGRSKQKRIQELGGRRDDGLPWRLPLDTAIAGIEAGRWTFHVGQGDAAADVLVEVSPTGSRYLQTRPDRRVDNNLLSLPECP